MKNLMIIPLLLFSLLVFSQTDKSNEQSSQVVEASCGQCNFGLKGGGCSLAVKIDGKAYFVDDVDLHDHGDAHGDLGMCNVVRKANVKGEIVKGRFKASYFQLIPYEEEKK